MDKFDCLFRINIKMLNFFSLGMSAIRRFQYSKKCLKKNIELKRYKTTDTLYVLGLGPSLKNVDLEKLDGDIICSNRFYKFEQAERCIPKFYCMMDDDFFVGKAVQNFLDAYEKYPQTQFLLNGKYRQAIEELVGIKENVYYVYGWSGVINENSNIDFTQNLPVALNVVCRMIQAGIYMGYKKIILLGCDFNSFATLKDKHCYEDKDDNVHWRLSYELFCYAFAAKEHEIINEIAQKYDVEILNATEGSLIDAYKRISI